MVVLISTWKDGLDSMVPMLYLQRQVRLVFKFCGATI
jgi:hypothetical protein